MRRPEDVWEVESPDTVMVLVACSQLKSPTPGPARGFYRGRLFQESVRWAESWDFPWMVLSGEHGLVAPDQEMAPYDVRISPADDERWALWRPQLPEHVQHLIVLGGAAYVAVAREVWPELPVWGPLQDLPDRGYGHYLAWLSRNTATPSDRTWRAG